MLFYFLHDSLNINRVIKICGITKDEIKHYCHDYFNLAVACEQKIVIEQVTDAQKE